MSSYLATGTLCVIESWSVPVKFVADELDSPSACDFGVKHLSGDPSMHDPLHEEPSSTTLDHDDLLQRVRSRLVPGIDPDSTIASPSDHSTVSSPGLLSPGGVHTPRESETILHDANTQMSLIEGYAKVHLEDSISSTLENNGTMWGGLPKGMVSPSGDNSATDTNCKVRKSFHNADIATHSHPGPELEGGMFDLDNVTPPPEPTSSSPSQFTFTKFGADVANNGSHQSGRDTATSTLDTSSLLDK